MTDAITPWDLGVEITAPCAGLSFRRLSDWKLVIVAHFSLMHGGMPKDLEFTFDRALAMNWAEEGFSSITQPLTGPLPKLVSEKWNGWTYPLLVVQESSWLHRYAFMPDAAGLSHIVLVAMNDVLELIAAPSPAIRWVDGALGLTKL
jgi:hypothetical protein